MATIFVSDASWIGTAPSDTLWTPPDIPVAPSSTLWDDVQWCWLLSLSLFERMDAIDDQNINPMLGSAMNNIHDGNVTPQPSHVLDRIQQQHDDLVDDINSIFY